MTSSTKERLQREVIVSRDPEVHSGDLVFRGTRVPVDTLVDHLKSGYTIEEFLQGFPSVERWQVEAFLELSPEAIEQMNERSAHTP
jgi:uncharacterized protein (DUF433 family)